MKQSEIGRCDSGGLNGLKAFLIVAILGPLAGGLLFALPIGIALAFDQAIREGILAILRTMLFVVLVSYAAGGPSALVAALILGLLVWWKGDVSIFHLLLIAVIGGVLGHVVTGLELWHAVTKGHIDKAVENALIIATISLLAALILLPVLRRIGILKRTVKMEL